jgi:hypothetical protein
MPAAAAKANTFCVSTPGCSNTSLPQALDDAKNHAGPDTVQIAAGSFQTSVGFSYDTPVPGNTVAIVGAGGRFSGHSGTSLSWTGANPSNKTVLTVKSPGQSTISGLDVIVPDGGNGGVDTNGAISDSAVEAASGTTSSPNGVVLETGGALTNSDVRLPTDLPVSLGVFAVGSGTLVDRSTIQAARGFQTTTSGGLSGVVRRSEIVSSVLGVQVDDGDFLVEDSVLRNTTENAGHDGAIVHGGSADNSLTLNHVTMIGSPASGTALRAFATSHTANLTFRNGVFAGYPATIFRLASGAGAAANVTTDYSDYSGPTGGDSGAGAITETNHLTVDPGFLSSTDFHLRADSPLIDAGDPAALGAAETTTDASGQSRIADGNGDCTPRRDIGAFEFQPGPRAPHAAAAAAPATAVIGQPVTFDAGDSCDPDGDALTYAWTFDQGPPATGVSHMRAFSTAGLHFATVTVTDSTGRSSTATATVRVTTAVLPAFAGVAIPSRQTVKVSRQRVAGVKLSCPGGTVGACAGTLTLTRSSGHKLGAASFSIARGVSRKVSVKLSASAFNSLRKSKRQNSTAVSVAHDANGTSKRTTRAIKLVAPR